MSPAHCCLPHEALPWLRRPGLGDLGGRGLPQPQEPHEPPGGQAVGSHHLRVGSLGEGRAIARLALAWN